MKRAIVIILAICGLSAAATVKEVLEAVDSSALLRSKSYETEAKRNLYYSKRGLEMPRVDVSFEALYLKEEPKLYLHLPPGLNLPPYFQAAAVNQYRGEISVSYPLFSGFAISAEIGRSLSELKKSELELADLKRRLYMRAVALYAALRAENFALNAARETTAALKSAYKKAKGFYEQGLIPKSDLYNIEAGLHKSLAKEEGVLAKIESIKASLEYLTSKRFQKPEGLPSVEIPADPIERALAEREDLLALRESLKIDSEDIRAAKSRFYPDIYLKAALRKYGDNLNLNGDGFKNGDESYVGIKISYNIFDGFADAKALEAAKYKRLAKRFYILDYERKIKSELYDSLKELDSLKARLDYARKRVLSARSYADLIRGRFENQLSSADELTRAVADLEAARAYEAAAESEIFTQKCKILLQVSLRRFQKDFGI